MRASDPSAPQSKQRQQLRGARHDGRGVSEDVRPAVARQHNAASQHHLSRLGPQIAGGAGGRRGIEIAAVGAWETAGHAAAPSRLRMQRTTLRWTACLELTKPGRVQTGEHMSPQSASRQLCLPSLPRLPLPAALP